MVRSKNERTLPSKPYRTDDTGLITQAFVSNSTSSDTGAFRQDKISNRRPGEQCQERATPQQAHIGQAKSTEQPKFCLS
jgi:hypothetical protein